MAYGAKYVHSFSDIYQNTTGQYVATIFKKDYTGFIYEITCTGTPLIIETDRNGESSYRPVIGSTATLNMLFQEGELRYWESVSETWNSYDGLWSASAFDFNEFLVAESDDFYIEIEKDGNIIWKGWYIPTSDVVINEIKPVEFTIRFSDFVLAKSTQYGSDIAPPPAPTQLATVSFAASSGGNLTFDGSTSSGLVIDTTTGGFHRIKNNGASAVYARFKCTFNVDYISIGDLDEVFIAAIKSNDSAVNTVLEQVNVYYPNGNTNIDVLLAPGDGVRFSFIINGFMGNPPTGTYQLLTTSGVEVDSIVDTNVAPVKYPAHEKISVLELMIKAMQATELNMEIRVASDYQTQFGYGLFEGAETKDVDLSNTYVLKNSMMRNDKEYYSFYEILEGVCSHFGLIAYQKNNILYICNYDLLVNKTIREFSRYSFSTGSLLGTITESDTVIDLNTSTFRNIGRSQIVTYSMPYKNVNIRNSSAAASNQVNSLMKVSATNGTVKYIPGWKLYGYATNDLQASGVDFREGRIYGYATSPTAPLNIRWGASSIFPIATTQNNARYLETETGISVTKGDYISISTSFSYDARLTAGYIPDTKVAFILRFPDPANTSNTLTLYLNDVSQQFVSTLTYLSNKNISIYGLKIPVDGEVFMRVLLPWSPGYPGGGTTSTTPWLFIDYAMIQTYKEDNSTTQTYTTFVEGVNNNNQSLTLDSKLYTYSVNRYISDYDAPYSSSVNGLNAFTLTNSIINEYYDFIPQDPLVPGSDVANSLVDSITEPIFLNNGLPSLSISGSYKSSLYSIGDKFDYDVSNIGSAMFTMLDYRNDLKQASQDVILYSSQFTDATGRNILTKLLVDN